MARWGSWAAATVTVLGIFGAASSTAALRIAFCLLAVASAGVCGGLVNRQAFLRSGRWDLLRTIGLVGVLTYVALLPALGYGDRVIYVLLGRASPWRLVFVATSVMLLFVGFEAASRLFRRDLHRSGRHP